MNPAVYTTILKTAIADVTSALTTVSADPLFGVKFTLAFGRTLSSEQFLQTVAVLPQIEVRSDAELKGALGAFSAQTQTIYLSESLLKGDLARLRSVLIEEIGHFLDTHVNCVDMAGDEGAIFAALVQGQCLDAKSLQTLKAEDDSALIIIEGESIGVEQNTLLDPISFTLNGSSQFAIGADGVSTILRLTDNYSQSGSAFLTNAITLSKNVSFSTYFKFQITDSQGLGDGDGAGADGLVFVI